MIEKKVKCDGDSSAWAGCLEGKNQRYVVRALSEIGHPEGFKFKSSEAGDEGQA